MFRDPIPARRAELPDIVEIPKQVRTFGWLVAMPCFVAAVMVIVNGLFDFSPAMTFEDTAVREIVRDGLRETVVAFADPSGPLGTHAVLDLGKRVRAGSRVVVAVSSGALGCAIIRSTLVVAGKREQ